MKYNSQVYDIYTENLDFCLSTFQAAKNVPHNDPTRSINLGLAHARLGNVSQAQQAFQAAANCKEHFDIVLSSGKVMNSRKAAMLSLQSLKKIDANQVADRALLAASNLM